jgi:hypothetical protein
LQPHNRYTWINETYIHYRSCRMDRYR